MVVQTLGDSNLGAVFPSSNLCKDWSRRRCSKVWFMSLICGSAEAFFAGLLPVAVTAPPPPVRRAPRSFTTGRRVRRKTTSKLGGEGEAEEGVPEWFCGGDNGVIEGSGLGFGFGGGDYRGRGWSYWSGGGSGGGGGWDKDDSGRGEWGLNFLYQAACWFSLSHCLYFALKKVLRVVHNGVNDSSSGEASAPFACCSSAIKHCTHGFGECVEA
ncbi:hypothetical protein SUGI_0113120 [Cryptomeria japonica]|uniref:uncharacterized protein LOC131035163 isoform X2 n=1 Tax=Cryptomeria japonica TaxID=3369 RepID=UPI002408BDB3|nr:uncharacterized protein LOC131035163 isoform X2 [Cryptomeria japonica]GLJ09632.1 hypothetical protein SUGI_0113120 [Cryptomeria japonica]